jgi:hypothetical protein
LEDSSTETTNRLRSLEKQFTKFDDLDTKVLAAVKEDLKALSKQLEESVDTQQTMSTSLMKIQSNSQKQFDDLGGYVIDAVEQVSTLSDTVTRMRDDIQQFSTLLSKLADRQYLTESDLKLHSPPSLSYHTTAKHPRTSPQTPEMQSPSILSDTSGSSTSHSNSSVSYPSTGSKSLASPGSQDTESYMLRSPAPKRTRDRIDAVDEDVEDYMQVDQTQQDSSSAIDTSFDDADDEEDAEETSSNRSHSSDGAGTCTNLTTRFNQAAPEVPQALSSLQVAAASTPRTSNSMSHHDPPSSHIDRNLPAPLDPQYTSETGPAGACKS